MRQMIWSISVCPLHRYVNCTLFQERQAFQYSQIYG